MKSFDIDGVVSLGICPGAEDVIITGRSIDEYTETMEMLTSRGIFNQVFFNPVPFAEKTRLSSAQHKARVINALEITRHFEDDPIQIEIIRSLCHNCYVVEVKSDLVNLENERKYNWRETDA